MGGRVSLGREDGRSRGGAVSVFSVSRLPGRAGLVSVLMMSFGLACSQQNPPPPPDAATLLQAVAAADPAKYPSLQETKHWSNPYLVIRPEAVGLLTNVTANEEQILKPGGSSERAGAVALICLALWARSRDPGG